METLGLNKTGGAQSEAATGVPPPRLVKAAHEFEAQLMKELMAPLTRGSSVPGVGGGMGASSDEDDQDSGSGGALGEFAAEALGQALSAAGGFGIANRILGEIGHAGGHKGNQAQPIR
jgi:hypothetical protein